MVAVGGRGSRSRAGENKRAFLPTYRSETKALTIGMEIVAVKLVGTTISLQFYSLFLMIKLKKMKIKIIIMPDKKI